MGEFLLRVVSLDIGVEAVCEVTIATKDMFGGRHGSFYLYTDGGGVGGACVGGGSATTTLFTKTGVILLFWYFCNNRTRGGEKVGEESGRWRRIGVE